MRFSRVTVLLLAAAFAGAAQQPDCGVVAGWQQDGPRRSYKADNLFDYMNGNAEGYLIYGFTQLNGVTCKKGAQKLLVDVFEMAGDESAYGVFCANRDPGATLESIGMAGQLLARKIIFAKDKYYVDVSAESEGDLTAAMREFAAALAARIPGKSAPPEVVSWFPKEKLDATSLRLVPQSVLGLRILGRGYVGQYENGKAFLVGEASPDAARGVMEKLRARFGETQPVQLADEAFRATDRYLGRMLVFRKGRYVGGFAANRDAPPGDDIAAALASQIKNPGQ